MDPRSSRGSGRSGIRGGGQGYPPTSTSMRAVVRIRPMIQIEKSMWQKKILKRDEDDPNSVILTLTKA